MKNILESDGFSIIPQSTNDTIKVDLLCSRPIFNVIVSDDPVAAEWLIHVNQVEHTDGIQSTHWFNLLFNSGYDRSNVTIFADELPNAMIQYNAVPYHPGYWLIPQINRIGFMTIVYKRGTSDNALLFIAISDNEVLMLQQRLMTNRIIKRRSSIFKYLMNTY